MSPKATGIFAHIKRLTDVINEKRLDYIQSIKVGRPFALTRDMFLEVKELEQQKKELQIRLSRVMDYGPVM